MDTCKWSEATYRLDEVVNRFNVPCVVQVSEGFLGDSELESMSSGDIIKIDEQRSLQKVAANFLTDFHLHCTDKPPDDSDYIDLAGKEILVPLNYQGKLKVLSEVKEYGTVAELSKDGPRFAKVLSNLRYPTRGGGHADIAAGTTIEIDRVIEASARANRGQMLVVKYSAKGREVEAALPVGSKGSFKTMRDQNFYTLKECIDRYNLPQVVRFESDDIKRAYTSDLLEGLANSRKITEKIQLNRLVTQNVLVGHYKALDEADDPSDGPRRRTLIVLPLDSQMMREIEVTVAEDMVESDYADVMKIFRNPLDGFDDGAIYVDFAMEDGIRVVSDIPDSTYQNAEAASRPPVRPKPSGKFRSKPRVPTPPPQTEEDYEPVEVKRSGLASRRLPARPDEDATLDGYMKSDRSKLPQTLGGEHPYIELVSDGFHDVDKGKKEKKQEVGEKKKHKKDKKRDKKEKEKEKKDSSKQKHDEPNTEDDDLHEYDYITDILPLKSTPPQPTADKHNLSRLPIPPNPNPRFDNDYRPFPSNTPKPFLELTTTELYERLVLCDMKGMAKACKNENLDGAFFEGIAEDVLKSDPFNLTGLSLHTFKRVQNNWVKPKHK